MMSMRVGDKYDNTHQEGLFSEKCKGVENASGRYHNYHRLLVMDFEPGFNFIPDIFLNTLVNQSRTKPD